VEESVVVEELLVVTQETTTGGAEEEDDASTQQPREDVESSSSVTFSSVVGPIQTSTPSTPAPPQEVTLVPATVKKSWADLLRTPTSSSSSSPASVSSGPAPRNTLPTSSVMGFSIPAGSTSSSNPTVPVSPSKKSELIALLTTGLNPNSTTAGSIIRSRGIVNIGNMCYANSVLQLLVYCTPFQRLFAELGKVLSESAVTGSSGSDSLVNGSGPSTSSSGSTSTPINGSNGKEKEKDKDAVGMTPLVDATVEFLREFMDDKKTKSKTKKQVHSKKGSVFVNGTGSGSSKGKEKETLLDGVDDDSSGEVDWEACDSFLPTYVYDAMKLKKRFDHMRVCSFFLPFDIFQTFIDRHLASLGWSSRRC
jgi:ubiquitin carboxyl-terminal hydrolase 10